MRRLFLGLLIVILTLAAILGGGLLLAKKEEADLPAPTETMTEVTEQTIPVTTETVPETEAVPETTVPVVEEKKTIDAVPLYYQTDYPYINFGNGTIATSGCSITCLAMVATYLTDQEYTPPQMAYHFGSFGKNIVECNLSDSLQKIFLTGTPHKILNIRNCVFYLVVDCQYPFRVNCHIHIYIANVVCCVVLWFFLLLLIFQNVCLSNFRSCEYCTPVIYVRISSHKILCYHF